ncbi:MAG: selenium-dependent molybdenum cofactor biosynthesis protein YqeB, partial [Desulfomonilaceae bacterium]
MNNLATLKILIRGAGEMASSAACRLFNSGFQRIVMTEVSQPLAVRRGVSFCDAVRYGWYEVEQIKAVKIDNVAQAEETWKNHLIPILVHPKNIANTIFRPDILVDAVMAKKNTGVHISDSPLVIALGPGFLAGRDAH